ncbi:uncharacterized protein [Blastocystis hominis]|uniref:Uncharacterized protein n=1 Tax=Blastocystis hominis TaxID=12968 RepID=D8LWQ4_BLAHO|nr:uncharacterized protein [Blastocystis hominis]CBK20243.2 unnamed protein product [Blastocystis hominis]|eukprot:XP_012894291.1 uncharacterized protein [Blastocystis hominis]
MQFTSQEVEEIIVFEEVEKELESVEKSFESGDMQSFGRNKKDIIDQFDKFRHYDEEVFRHHCDAVIGAHLVATADSEGEKDGDDSIEKRKAQLLQARNSIQMKVCFVFECDL